ncbi:MAG: hypothetical protein A2Y57_03615 [Candidatus Woykebacteria bacterium RBG_13_40_7b]|uniref:DUF3465 domain-containing protein n=1 Tax=Candidatus Woykebacteria bacterium RBG_13_40_7b TaxID=1802594 RepID=A0A1G1WBT5_9BACT|nr:MAG: hypothetical protein A2Y57_03615 [Candidatus Woykebacteria bacterium RBG_13_40_7b]
MTPEEAFKRQLSEIPLTTEGEVVRLLEDDTEGVPHQRFIIKLRSGHTLLVVNNLELGERLGLKEGGFVEVLGTYIWNNEGGVIHETHAQEEGSPYEEGYILVKNESPS